MKQGRETTQEERIEIAKECLASGKNYGEMALKYKVSYQQARTWTLRYEEMGEAGLEDRRGKRKKDQIVMPVRSFFLRLRQLVSGRKTFCRSFTNKGETSKV